MEAVVVDLWEPDIRETAGNAAVRQTEIFGAVEGATCRAAFVIGVTAAPARRDRVTAATSRSVLAMGKFRTRTIVSGLPL